MNISEKLLEAAEKIQTVFDSGVSVGWEQGRQKQYDEYWDSFQQNGTRKIYSNGFNGSGWTTKTLKPKYLIKPIDTSSTSQYGIQMFYRANEEASEYLDFSLIADKFDFSELKMVTSMFDSCKFTNVVADFSNAEVASLAFAARWYGSVNKAAIKVTEKLTTVTNMFYYNRNLTELILIEGSVIACNDLNLQWSTNLSHDSLISVINALKDYSGGTTHTITIGSTNLAKLTADELLIAKNKNWEVI